MGRKKKIREILEPLTIENPEPEEEVNPPAVANEIIEIPLPPAAPPEFKQKWRFVSNSFPNLGIGFKGVMHQFQNGVLETDDPDFARALENHPWFKINFHRG